MSTILRGLSFLMAGVGLAAYVGTIFYMGTATGETLVHIGHSEMITACFLSQRALHRRGGSVPRSE